MPITWRDALSVGDSQVDDDHQHMVEIINEFEVAASGKMNHKAIAHVLMGLVQYTREHFQREEALQREIQYPYYTAHRRAHQDVIRKLGDLLKEYVDEKNPIKRDDAIRHLSTFLREWLVNHIIEVDLRMKPFIAEHQKKMRKAAGGPRKGTVRTAVTP